MSINKITTMTIIELYNSNIYQRYTELINAGKDKNNFDNNDLWKIFEWYSCIKLSKEHKTIFYNYEDIEPEFKENNNMSKNDTGIDACNLIDTIVQCKLRNKSLTLGEVATFLSSQNIFCEMLEKTIIKWNKLIITRNMDCALSNNLLSRKKIFLDKPIDKNEMINYCEDLIKNPPVLPVVKELNLKLRDYQKECVELINKTVDKNVVICVPTGTGKNIIMINSLLNDKKYLILVPRIILMEQLYEEIIKFKPKLKGHIQMIGDNNNVFNDKKNITICVYNSVKLVKNNKYDKIFIDEAHHIQIPEIYTIDNEENNEENIVDVDLNDDNEDIEEIINNSDTEENYDNIEEEKETENNYLLDIKNLHECKNNVYLSATIDEIPNFEYYKKDIRYMIEQKYLCDYTIHVPVFNEDKTNTNICKYLLKNHSNIIVYCNTQKEGIEINNLLNKLQSNSSEYIDCETPKKKRNDIIKKYKEGKIPFLVNVRILVEGFDAPITKGVCFIHLPSNGTTLIQIIGRALRLHPSKTIAKIILPYSSDDDEKSISNFLKVIARNDSRIMKSYQNKKLGGYISFENEIEENNDKIEDKDNFEFLFEKIYNSMGKLKNGFEIWNTRLEQAKEYINKHKKRPSVKDTDKNVKRLGSWMSNQQQSYVKNILIMNHIAIRKQWEKFLVEHEKYYLSNEEVWNNNFEKLRNYIDHNKERPSHHDENKSIAQIGKWLDHQLYNYKNNKNLMTNNKIRILWSNFMVSYGHCFTSKNEEWNNSLEKVIKYIDKNNKKPSRSDKDKNIMQIAEWLSAQQINYKNNQYSMSDENIRKKWEEFFTKYKEFVVSRDEKWKTNLEKIKKYIDENNKRPSRNDENENIRSYSSWISTQLQNYKKKEKNNVVKKEWEEFITSDKYKKFFETTKRKRKKNILIEIMKTIV